MTSSLANQITPTSGTIRFPAGITNRILVISPINDEMPEYETWFLINITDVTSGAVISRDKNIVNVTMLASDSPSGKVAFAVDSRYLFN